MPMSTRSSVPWASSSTSTAIRCNARDMARASRMIVRSGRLISGLEGNRRTSGVNGGPTAERPAVAVALSLPVTLAFSVHLVLLLRLAPAIFCDVQRTEPGAHGHVQVVRPEPAGPGREEVERRTVKRQRRGAVERGAVDSGPQVHRGRPRVGSLRARRHPQVLAPDAARPPGGVR